jgi:hypothetical protein
MGMAFTCFQEEIATKESSLKDGSMAEVFTSIVQVRCMTVNG